MTTNKTKQGLEFEKALRVVRTRIEKQLRDNGKLKAGQTFDIDLYRMTGISANVWNRKRSDILHIYYFHPNGKFKF